MPATLLSEEVKTRIPPLYSQDRTPDPIVYARLFSPGSSWQCFVTEGSNRNDTFLIFGLFVGDGRRWGQIELGRLANMLADEGAELCVDPEFKPVRLSTITGVQRKACHAS